MIFSKLTRLRKAYIFAASLLVFAVPIPPAARAQENIDDLFNNPGEGIIEKESDTIDPGLIGVDKRPKFGFEATINGGLLLGISQWENPFSNSELWEFLPFGSFGLNASLEYRPFSQLGVYVSIKTNFPEKAIPLDKLSILLDELFFDYTLLEIAEFRAGKFAMTWGQGQILNPGNLVSAAADSFAVRAFLPLGSNGITAVAMAELDDLSNNDGYRYTGQFTGNLGPLTMGVAGTYGKADGLRTSAFTKTVLAGIDSAVEIILDWPDKLDSNNPPRTQALVAFFYEGGNPHWEIIAEYLFDGNIKKWTEHQLVTGIRIRDWLQKGWTPGILWQHRFSDNSGHVLIGFDGQLTPSLDMIIGFPILYGNKLPLSLPKRKGLIEIPGAPAASIVVQFSLNITHQE